MSLKDLISSARLIENVYIDNVIVPLIIRHKSVYKEIENRTGIPAVFVAAIHYRENTSDLGKFQTYLGNGQPLDRKTTIVPVGRGPFNSWTEGAIDVLVKLKRLGGINWDIETACYEWEKYNGFGYKNRGKLSPYVWNGTQHGIGTGYFTSDGKYDANAVNQTIGCFYLFKRLSAQDSDFKINKETEVKEMQPKKSLFDLIISFLERLFGAVSSVKEDLFFKTISYIPQLGDKSDNTKALQERLNKLQNANLKVDGDFGPATLRAVQAFQKSKGLAGSGMLGDKTIEFLGLKVEARPSVLAGPINQKIMEIARKEIGVKEIAGPRHNPRIIEYHSTTGKFSDDETAWCSSFCKWVCLEAGVSQSSLSGVTATARSWLNALVPTNSPKEADIVVFWRVARDSWQGHVGFYVGETSTHIRVLGGNQNNEVNITLYSKSQLLGYRTYS